MKLEKKALGVALTFGNKAIPAVEPMGLSHAKAALKGGTAPQVVYRAVASIIDAAMHQKPEGDSSIDPGAILRANIASHNLSDGEYSDDDVTEAKKAVSKLLKATMVEAGFVWPTKDAATTTSKTAAQYVSKLAAYFVAGGELRVPDKLMSAEAVKAGTVVFVPIQAITARKLQDEGERQQATAAKVARAIVAARGGKEAAPLAVESFARYLRSGQDGESESFLSTDDVRNFAEMLRAAANAVEAAIRESVATK